MKDNKSIFRGNANLKASNVTLEFSKDKVEELTKCYNDPVYFIKNYVKIVHIDKGLVPFELYPYQEDMVRTIIGNRQVIMKCQRQTGKSTVSAACVLWYLIFEEYKTVAILANKGATAREILGRVQNMYMGLPAWMQPGVTNWNKGSFSLANNNTCIAASTSSSAIRGCIAGNTVLRIKENGKEQEITIAELFKILRSNIKNTAKNTQGILIEAPNGWVTFNAVIRYKYNKLLFIKTNNGSIAVSENHPLYTSKGWKRANKLKTGDILIKKNGQAKITNIVEKKENAYLYDIVNAGNSDKENAVELNFDYFKI